MSVKKRTIVQLHPSRSRRQIANYRMRYRQETASVPVDQALREAADKMELNLKVIEALGLDDAALDMALSQLGEVAGYLKAASDILK